MPAPRALGKTGQMKYDNLGEYSNINRFVEAKLGRLHEQAPDFSVLYELMFSEGGNILFERSVGYRIEKTTYAQARERIEHLSGGFASLTAQLPPDSVVGLYMDNSVDWIIAFWMLLRCGFRPLLMNLRLSDALLSQALQSADARCVVSDGKKFGVPTIIYSEIAEAAPVDCAFGSEVLVMSSGTSEHLKVCAYGAAEFTHQIEDSYHIIRKCAQVKRHCDGQLKLLTFLPFYHVFGLIAVYIWFAFFSRTFVQLNDLAPQTIVNTIRRHRVTHIFAVPMFWNKVYEQALRTIHDRGGKTEEKFQKGLAIAEKIGDVPLLGDAFCRFAFREVRDNLFGDSIRFMITGGSEIGGEVLTFFNSIGYHLCNGYGMTELGITSVELSPKKRIRNAGFVGKPLSSAEYSLTDGGELLVRGSSTAKYILQDGKRLPEADWFNTHDLAECLSGHYRILGRSDDLVIGTDGENLNPNLLEPQLRVSGAQEICLIGTPEPALVVSVDRHITRSRAAELTSALRERMAQQKLNARLILTSDALISGDDFKLNRGRIARSYARGGLTVLDPLTLRETDAIPDDELMAYLRDLFALSLGKKPGDVPLDADFFLDEGGTSLDYFAMIAKLQEDYPVSFPSSEAGSLNSIRALYDYIKAAIEP